MNFDNILLDKLTAQVMEILGQAGHDVQGTGCVDWDNALEAERGEDALLSLITINEIEIDLVIWLNVFKFTTRK